MRPLLFLLLLVAAPSLSAGEPTEPELIQTVPNKTFGTVKLPLAWDSEDIEHGLRAIEPFKLSQSTAVLEVVFVAEVTDPSTMAHWLELFGAELRQDHPAIQLSPLQAIPDRQGHRLDFTATESDHPMRYTVVVLPWQKAMLMASLGMPTDRTDLDPVGLLLAVIDSISPL